MMSIRILNLQNIWLETLKMNLFGMYLPEHLKIPQKKNSGSILFKLIVQYLNEQLDKNVLMLFRNVMMCNMMIHVLRILLFFLNV